MVPLLTLKASSAAAVCSACTGGAWNPRWNMCCNRYKVQWRMQKERKLYGESKLWKWKILSVLLTVSFSFSFRSYGKLNFIKSIPSSGAVTKFNSTKRLQISISSFSQIFFVREKRLSAEIFLEIAQSTFRLLQTHWRAIKAERNLFVEIWKKCWQKIKKCWP